jgi:small-conductance mechanosensitive channel
MLDFFNRKGGQPVTEARNQALQLANWRAARHDHVAKATELLIKALVAAHPTKDEPPKEPGKRELYVTLRHDLMVRVEYLNRLKEEHKAIADSYQEEAKVILTGKPKADLTGHRYG